MESGNVSLVSIPFNAIAFFFGYGVIAPMAKRIAAQQTPGSEVKAFEDPKSLKGSNGVAGTSRFVFATSGKL